MLDNRVKQACGLSSEWPVEGAPFLKGVHVIRNGASLSGSDADPVPKWVWGFIAACAIIPVVSLGGAVPAATAVAGVSGTLSVARFNRWSLALRAGAWALIALACWGLFGMLLMAFRGAAPTTEWKVPITSALFMSSSPEKLIDEIDAAYTRRGHNEKATSQIRDTLRQSCDRMEKKHCVAYLRTALLEIQNGHTN